MKLVGILAAIGIAASLFNSNAQDHGHINVGAESQSAGSKLIFANAAAFATNSGYVKTLMYTNGGTYAGFFNGNTTVTALPATAERGGPDPQAPALGSQIFAQLVSLQGPDGGEFKFWHGGVPIITIQSGATGEQTWIVSENDGSPGTDPYGHIHGRRWTLGAPGLYVLGIRALDLSTNGPSGGPIHTPSEVLYTYVQAGVNVLSVQTAADQTIIRAALPLGNNWQLESTETLANPSWTSVGDPLVGDDFIHEIVDARPQVTQRIYRLTTAP